MNTLTLKELRLLLPATLAALILAIVPVWFLPRNPWTSSEMTLYPFAFGIALMALGSFGREMALSTFPLLLAQPIARSRIWWTKVRVLAAASAVVLAVWWASWSIYGFTGTTPSDTLETTLLGVPMALALLSGGLWSTLLLRQVAGAFLVTILLPASIAVLIAALRMETPLPWVCAGLVVYAIAGFLLAWWLFLRAQEVMWTGDAVTLSDLFPTRKSGSSSGESPIRPGHTHTALNTPRIVAGQPSRAADRPCRPIRALISKELHFHQVSLAGIAALALLHVGVVLIRWLLRGHQIEGMLEGILNFYPFIWLFVPLLVGSLSIAEERRLGTMEAHLGMPVRRRIQFMIKLLSVICLGALLSFLLLVVVEAFGVVLGAPAAIGIFESGTTFAVIFCCLLALSLLAFYASSLSRNLLQALGLAVGFAGCLFFLVATGPAIHNLINIPLWQGRIFHWIAWPILILTVLALTCHNFGRLAPDFALWRRNLLTILSALGIIGIITFSLYQRAWELCMEMEPPRGPVRLKHSEPPAIKMENVANSCVSLLPDGRVIATRLSVQAAGARIKSVRLEGSDGVTYWMNAHHQLMGGSNWIDALVLPTKLVAIRSDGSLWFSEKAASKSQTQKRDLGDSDFPALSQFGNTTNWSKIARQIGLHSVVLLSTDGSLWRWGTNSQTADKGPALASRQPRQLGISSDWATSVASDRFIYLWKTNGEAWLLHTDRADSNKKSVEIDPGLFLVRFPDFDRTTWRCVTSTMGCEVGIRADGTLWCWQFWPNVHQNPTKPSRLQADKDWAVVCGNWGFLSALKTDGSLWLWRNYQNGMGSIFQMGGSNPTRLGRHNDWLAMTTTYEGVISLSADGGLCYWQGGLGYPPPLLAPSRRPVPLENLLGDE